VAGLAASGHRDHGKGGFMNGQRARRDAPAKDADRLPPGGQLPAASGWSGGWGTRWTGPPPVAGARTVVDGDRRVTYAQLAGRVARLGGGLRALGVEPGGVVAVLALNSLEHLECWLGIPRCGAVLNDLNLRLALRERQVGHHLPHRRGAASAPQLDYATLGYSAATGPQQCEAPGPAHIHRC